MFDKSGKRRADQFENVIERYNRAVILLVALCCLSIGIAIGALVHGIAGARSDDNRLSISYSPTTPDSLSAAFARVSSMVRPAVVNIRVSEGDEHGPFARDTTGSGIIVNPAGYILTNYHVVEKATGIKVRLSGAQEFEAKIIGQDLETDLAVIKIDAHESLPVARMGDSEKLNVGDWVLAIGSPFGFEQSVTAGIISAKDRTSDQVGPAGTGGQTVFQRFLQTDAAINPGNSGGPLVNLAGEVVGINTMIATSTGAYNGIGFALPSSTAVAIYNQLVEGGRVRRGFLGIELRDLTPQVMRQYGIGSNQGVIVKDLTSPESAAARAGIKSMDVIVAINGVKVKDTRDLINRVASLPAGSNATVTYVRDGQPHNASVKLDERQEPEAANLTGPKTGPLDPHHRGLTGPGQEANRDPTAKPPDLGLVVETLNATRARGIGMPGAHGAVVNTVDNWSPSGDIKTNDVIFEVNKRPIGSKEEFERAIGQLKSGDDVVIRVFRKDPGSGMRVSSDIISFTLP
jgi:serine protease Do